MRHRFEAKRDIVRAVLAGAALVLPGCGGPEPSAGEPAAIDVPLLPAEAGTAELAPPTRLHWMRAGASVRLVFSRSEDDTADERRVARYVVCTPAACRSTELNYLDLAPEEARAAVAYAADASGALGGPSDLARASVDGVLDLDGVGAAASALVASSVTAPMPGPFVVLGPSAASNKTTGAWSFWQHKSGFHKPSGGIDGSDDTFAWDINLNVSGAGSDMDAGMLFYAVATGTVTKWSGTILPGVGATKPILVDHGGYWSGYLHASVVYAKEGDQVSPFTALGKIGGSTGYPNHLHLATYSGENKTGKLKSYDAALTQGSMDILLGSPSSIGVGASLLLPATGCRIAVLGLCVWGATNLNDAAVFKNTWWKSSKPAVVKVDGYGKITGVAKGTADISVLYSGKWGTKTITVN